MIADYDDLILYVAGDDTHNIPNRNNPIVDCTKSASVCGRRRALTMIDKFNCSISTTLYRSRGCREERRGSEERKKDILFLFQTEIVLIKM